MMKHINNLSTIDTHTSDIVTNIYYVTPHQCRIVTRQFDDIPCPKLDITIHNEVFTIDPSLITNDVTFANDFLISQENYDRPQRIPKIIIQTSETYKTSPQIELLKEFNPEYEYRFFNDAQRREFLKVTFLPKVIEAYDMLVPGAFKADIFRYGYLFIHGGCYFDDKIIVRESLRNIIRPDDELILCEDVESDSILNSIIMTTPQNFLFLKLLLTACDNILSRQMNDVLSLTGPKLMYAIFKPFLTSQNVRFKHTVVNNDFSSYKNFLINDRESQRLLFSKTTQESLNTFCHDPNHYRQLWNRNEIFYKNKVSIHNVTLYVYPNPYVDTFKFAIDHNELTIERSDCDNPWYFYLKVKILDRDSSEHALLDVGWNRVRNFNIHLLKLPERVFLSSNLKAGDFTFPPTSSSSSIVLLFSTQVAYQKKENETVIICESTPLTNEELTHVSYDYVVFFTGSDAVYHCSEKDERTKQIYMTHTVLTTLQPNVTVKLIVDGKEVEIPTNHISQFISNLPALYKKPSLDFVTFCENYRYIDIPTLYHQVIETNNHMIVALSEIIKSSGELLEGNVFYEHHSSDFNVNAAFQHKRLNLFYYGKLAVDILEIGFNAGHSALLYLLANPFSKIHFFDLGEHQYSQMCFDYLNEKFPGRLSVTWGDSTVTIPQYSQTTGYDFIHIDGGHTRFIAESDVHNCRSLAKSHALVMIDDYDGNCLHTFCNQLLKYQKLKKHDLLYYNQYHLLCSYV
jgi:mannosyltransferase OCH1-like enzyme